jgi:ABC-type bacteriocin/lantibiotic exporter with double-glycine peptidase domain
VRSRRYLRTPVVPQMEEQDCGGACLAAVLGAFGRRTTLQEASRACGVSRDGVSAAAVARAAGSFGLTTRAMRMTRGDTGQLGLEKLPVPAMVLVKGPHFAIFEGIRRGRVRVNDPSLGKYSTTSAGFWGDFGGIAVGFEPGPDFERGGERLPFARDLLRRIRPYARPLALAIVSALLLAVPGVAAAFALRSYLIRVVVQGNTSWSVPIVLAVVTAGAVIVLGTWLQQTVVNRVLAIMSVESSRRFLWRMLRLPGVFFQRRNIGGLVTRVQMNDGLAVLLSSRAATAVAAVGAASVHLAALVWLDWQLSVVPVTVAVLDVIALRLVARRRGGRMHRLHVEQFKRDGLAFSGVSAIETLKAEGAEEVFFRSWAGWQTRALNTAQAMASSIQTLLSLPNALNTAAVGSSVVLGMRQLIDGSENFGTLLAFLLLLNGFLLPVTALVGIGSELMIARAQAALLEDVETAEPDPYLQPVLSIPAGDQRPLSGGLELRDITFGYDQNRAPLIDGLTMKIEPGEWLAVVGASGSGKSTLARVAAGSLRPWSGEVLLDGQPRDRVARAHVTSAVAYVEQQLRLFEGTVRENLTLWNPAVSERAVSAALVDAEAAELVERRGGLDGAVVSEDARNLSGGERQRLELARALTLEPRLLILDEATSALDAHVEAQVGDHLRRRGTACLLLAHRLCTVKMADRILVLSEGRVVQEGSHDELARVPGTYRSLLAEMS